MRTFSRNQMAGAMGVVIALGALAFLGGKPAAAQINVGPTPSTPNYTTAIRLGGYLPFDTTIRQNVNNVLYNVGIDYAIKNVPGSERTVISVDYMDRTSGNFHMQIIPLTIGQSNYNGGDKNNRPYIGYGIGFYFVQEALLDVLEDPYTKNGMAYGGYLSAGMDFQDRYFLDARYHYVSPIGPVSAQGLQISAGVRF